MVAPAAAPEAARSVRPTSQKRNAVAVHTALKLVATFTTKGMVLELRRRRG